MKNMKVSKTRKKISDPKNWAVVLCRFTAKTMLLSGMVAANCTAKEAGEIADSYPGKGYVMVIEHETLALMEEYARLGVAKFML